jgi:hypothetical protein
MVIRLLMSFLLASSLGAAFYTPGIEAVPEISISSREFVRLMTDLSEPEGYFDSDNFISNEGAYLKILPDIGQQVAGGAYIGVGPDQNYSYIAHLRPQIAFIIDIRRQNALQHLYFKALFQLSSNRVQYLERLFGRRIEATGAARAYGISDLLRRIDASRFDKRFAEKKVGEAIKLIQSWGTDLRSADYESIRFIAQAFTAKGPDLKFTSFNRPPRSQYPSYRELLEGTDSQGSQSNYLASEDYFLLIKKMHRENRIIPIVGDLAGGYALSQVGEELRRRKIDVTCFYTSNVEFYLYGGTGWEAYVRNVVNLPRTGNALMIRSYARFWRPDSTPLYRDYMQTTVQSIEQFLADEKAGKGYRNLILRPPQR